MSEKVEIKKLEHKIDMLIESLKELSEKQNSQYTDIVLHLKQIESNTSKLYPIEDKRTDEELYKEACKQVREANKASTSWLQRKLGIEYSRAMQIVNLLEKNGVIGPARGSKARKVFLK